MIEDFSVAIKYVFNFFPIALSESERFSFVYYANRCLLITHLV